MKDKTFHKDHRINWWLTALTVVLSLTVLIPLYFTIVTALKTPAEAATLRLAPSWPGPNFAGASAQGG